MSKTDVWMPLYVGDYLADTMHLNAQEHGAYLLLLMHYWRTGPLLDDDKALSGIARVERKVWDRDVGPVVRQFFTAEGGRLHQKRIDTERAKSGDVSEKRRAAGKRGAAAKWSKPAEPEQAQAAPMANATASASVLPWQNDGQSQSQSEVPSLRSGRGDADAGPASPPPDARTTLFREGLDRLRRLTGLDRGRGAALLGRLLKAAADDCAAVGLVLAEAEALRPADPVPWLIRTVESRARGRDPGASRPGKPIVRSPFEVIAERRARREAEGEFTLQ